jgi:hypothetical protein
MPRIPILIIHRVPRVSRGGGLAQRRRGAEEDRECRNFESAFCNSFGQQVKNTPPSKRLGSGHGPYRLTWHYRKRHRVLCGRLSGWGGLAQRRRGAEGDREDREDRECRDVESAFCNCLGQQVKNTPPSKRLGSGHGPYRLTWHYRKRHRILCGRLSGWESPPFSTTAYRLLRATGSRNEKAGDGSPA